VLLLSPFLRREEGEGEEEEEDDDRWDSSQGEFDGEGFFPNSASAFYMSTRRLEIFNIRIINSTFKSATEIAQLHSPFNGHSIS
jgi:hypothetical protein